MNEARTIRIVDPEKQAEIKRLAQDAVAEISDEEIDYIRELTIKLAQTIEKGNYKTLVYLDKSARPIDHLLRAWLTLIDKRNRHVNVRYLNIGSEKKSVREGEILETISNHERAQWRDITGNILIIDEMIFTGSSQRKAMVLVNTLVDKKCSIHMFDFGDVNRNTIGINHFSWSKKNNQEKFPFNTDQQNKNSAHVSLKDEKDDLYPGYYHYYMDALKERVFPELIPEV